MQKDACRVISVCNQKGGVSKSTTVLNLGIGLAREGKKVLIIDRMGMSVKNEWLDEENRMYIIYPIDEISKDMGEGRRKAMECLSELEKEGLVQKQVRGNGLPNLLYVKDFVII